MSRHTGRRLCAAAIFLAIQWIAPVAAQEHDHGAETHGRPSHPSISLEAVLDLVESRNPSLRSARLNAEALATVPEQVSAWPDPMVGVGFQPVPMLTAHGAQRTQWTIEQTVPYPGKLSLREQIASLDAAVAVHEGEALLDDLLLQAKEAYYELYRLAELERLIEDFSAELQSFAEAAAIRYEVGQGPQQALLRAQLEKNQLLQRLHHLEGARRRAAETLARLTDRPEGPRYFLVAEPVPARMDDLDAADLSRTAVERRPEFDALEVAATQAARQVELARKEFYPDVGLQITYFDIAARETPPSATGRDAVAIGASVRIPLHRGRIRARIEEARLRQLQIEAEQEALRTEYRTHIEELLATIEHESLSIEEYESILLPQAASTVEASLSAYATGTADFLDVIDAERAVFALRTGYVDATARLLTLSARLERALGIRALDELIPSPTAHDADPPVVGPDPSTSWDPDDPLNPIAVQP